MELLSNFDLVSYSKALKIPLIKLLAKDLYDDIEPRVGAYIVNMEDSDDGNGTHWVGFIISENIACYYDSYGMGIPSDIKRFLKRFKKRLTVIYSIDQIQTMKSVACGWYVLYFLYFFTVLHKGDTNFRLLMNKHNAIFSMRNKQLNDRILQKLIRNVFGK